MKNQYDTVAWILTCKEYEARDLAKLATPDYLRMIETMYRV